MFPPVETLSCSQNLDTVCLNCQGWLMYLSDVPLLGLDDHSPGPRLAPHPAGGHKSGQVMSDHLDFRTSHLVSAEQRKCPLDSGVVRLLRLIPVYFCTVLIVHNMKNVRINKPFLPPYPDHCRLDVFEEGLHLLLVGAQD